MEKSAKSPFRSYLWLIFVILIAVWLMQTLKGNSETYSYGQMKTDVSEGSVVSASITPDAAGNAGYVTVTFKNGLSQRVYVTSVSEAEKLLRDAGLDPVVRDRSMVNWVVNILLPIVLLAVVMVFLLSAVLGPPPSQSANSKMFTFGKSRAVITNGDGKITFEDVAGLKEEKEDLVEIVDFLKDPAKYTNLGARIPKGVLLEGEQVRPFLPRLWREKPRCRFYPYPVPISWRCSSVSVLPESGIFLKKPKSMPPALFS